MRVLLALGQAQQWQEVPGRTHRGGLTNLVKRLKLKVGQKAYAIVKSDNVIVGVD